jgi:cyanophycinase
MSKSTQGKLIISGGVEDEDGKQTILKQVVRLVHGDGSLLLMTVATQHPEETARGYKQLFSDMGVKKIDWLDIRTREDGQKEENIDKIKQAAMLFFTGGDQLRITSQMADTPVYNTMLEYFQKGLHIFGTSAGAAVVSATMLVSGKSDESNEVANIHMAPGFALIDGIVVDSHFAERGRMGRLLAVVAQNPSNLCIGIDQNTAIVIDRNEIFRVIGDGAVYVIDGSEMTYSNLSQDTFEDMLTIHNVKLHMLSEGEKFDLQTRQPIVKEEEDSKA